MAESQVDEREACPRYLGVCMEASIRWRPEEEGAEGVGESNVAKYWIFGSVC